MTTPDNAPHDTRETFGHLLWEEVVKPTVETAERHQQFDTLIHCHDQLVSLYALMQNRQFQPYYTALCLDQYLCMLEHAIEQLHQEIIANENL